MRHPVLTYLTLTFAISWGGLLLVGAPGLLAAPAVQLAVLLGLSAFSPTFVPSIVHAPDRGLLLASAVGYGLAGGLSAPDGVGGQHLAGGVPTWLFMLAPPTVLA